jgi:hypothetical protein
MWGSENAHIHTEVVRYGHKVNVWCTLTKDCVIGQFFSCKRR